MVLRNSNTTHWWLMCSSCPLSLSPHFNRRFGRNFETQCGRLFFSSRESLMKNLKNKPFVWSSLSLTLKPGRVKLTCDCWRPKAVLFHLTLSLAAWEAVNPVCCCYTGAVVERKQILSLKYKLEVLIFYTSAPLQFRGGLPFFETSAVPLQIKWQYNIKHFWYLRFKQEIIIKS